MIEFLVVQIKLGKISFEQIPEKFRAEVQSKIE